MLSVMLDSGAFSVWKNDSTIDIQKYIRFIEEVGEVEYIVNLDVLPGSYGQTQTAEQVEQSAKLSWKNFEYLRGRGLSVLPVFHQGEDWGWLDRMIDEGCDYIGLGLINSAPVARKRRWLDEVFTRITNKDGWPIVRLHGFGVTSVVLMNRYPWYSCDSVSWIMAGAYGGIYVPMRDPLTGAYDYGKPPNMVAVSSQESPNRRSTSFLNLRKSTHFLKLSPDVQQYVVTFVEKELGIPFDRVQEYKRHRNDALLAFFIQYVKQRVGQPFAHPTSSPFLEDRRHGRKGQPMPHLRLFFGNDIDPVLCIFMYKRKVMDHLVSYDRVGRQRMGADEMKLYITSDGRLCRGVDFDSC